ncbi:MAG: sulfite exporter TauE/SafE family protein [Deltaproteobacteria bacterium]|nr:sulfite exporter TauE/SafE family protein [Deltaproteobacteria bacterium]
MDANVILLILGGFLGEFIDSSIGMLYGTILSPVLIIAGYDPRVVVPSILLTQAMAGLVAAIGHHRLRNVDFSIDNGALKKRKGAGFINSLKKAMTRDSKVVIVVSVLGILAVVGASLVAVSIPEVALKTYIGVLVLVMGAILVSRSKFTFSWNKILGIGALSAFNKGLSGGGFGPVVTSGQMISGRGSKRDVNLEPRGLLGNWGDRWGTCWPTYYGKDQIREGNENRPRDLSNCVGDMDSGQDVADLAFRATVITA